MAEDITELPEYEEEDDNLKLEEGVHKGYCFCSVAVAVVPTTKWR
jgi:hypothetical protein